MIDVRAIKRGDIDAVVGMARAMHGESILRGLVWDDMRARMIIESALTSSSFLAILAECDGVPVGMMGAQITLPMFSMEPVSMDMVLYVSPPYRGKGAGEALIGVYVEWARSMGVRVIQAGVTSGINTGEAVRLYESCGFRVTGHHLTLEV